MGRTLKPNTIDGSGSFTFDLTDDSGINRTELFVDGSVTSTVSGNASSNQQISQSTNYQIPWNPDSTNDGSHTVTIKAYDTLGNSSSETFTANVQLAVPTVAPIITSPVNGTKTNIPEIAVAGNIPNYTASNTEVILSITNLDINETVEKTIPLSSVSTFSTIVSLTDYWPLITGNCKLQGSLKNRAGSGPLSGSIIFEIDTDIPAAPANLTGRPLAEGKIRLNWSSSETGIDHYNIYRSESEDGTKSKIAESSATTFTDTLTGDSLLSTHYYSLTSVDSANNESEFSNTVSVTPDNTSPFVTSINITTSSISNQQSQIINLILSPYFVYDSEKDLKSAISNQQSVINLTVSEKLSGSPFLSLSPNGGYPQTIELAQTSETEFEGTITVTDSTPSGRANFIFSAGDAAGNRGSFIPEEYRVG